jgi:hypothetical protein
MRSDTNLSRRSLLAGVPAVAAMAAPTTATALSGLPVSPDAELLELGRKLAPLVADIAAAKGVERDDDFWGDILGEASNLLEEILKYQPTTLEGFAVQLLAVVTSYDDMWDEDSPLQIPLSMATFFKNACRFAGMPISVPA